MVTMSGPLWMGAAAGLVSGAGFLAYAVRGRSSTIFGQSVYHGDRSMRSLALTFDDGPSESTPALLAILEKYRVPATFFMCGTNVRRCPAIAREVAARGHEIGNHSDSHPRFDFKSPGYIWGELARAQEAITGSTGITPRWFRAPYGVRWFGLDQAQRRLHLTGVMWTTIGRDWKWPPDRISSLLSKEASNGAILCLHDGRVTQTKPDIGATLSAVDSAIPRLLDRGFRFETVTTILCPKN